MSPKRLEILFLSHGQALCPFAASAGDRLLADGRRLRLLTRVRHAIITGCGSECAERMEKR